MSLGVLSEKGQKAVEQARVGLSLIPRKYIETSQSREGAIDGFFLNDSGEYIAAAFEVKARDMTLERLNKSFAGEWLLTFEKIKKGAEVAKHLCVPFFGVVYLVPEDKTLLIKLTDDHGNIVAPMRLEVTPTQATCNGGSAMRTNAYISMHSARVFKRITI